MAPLFRAFTYTPPIHHFSLANSNFPVISFRSSQSSWFISKKRQSNFLVLTVHVLPSSSFQSSNSLPIIILSFLFLQSRWFTSKLDQYNFIPFLVPFSLKCFTISLLSSSHSKIVSILNFSLPRSANFFSLFSSFVCSCPLVPCYLTFPVFSCPHKFSNSCFACQKFSLTLFSSHDGPHLVQLFCIFHYCVPVQKLHSNLLPPSCYIPGEGMGIPMNQNILTRF